MCSGAVERGKKQKQKDHTPSQQQPSSNTHSPFSSPLTPPDPSLAFALLLSLGGVKLKKGNWERRSTHLLLPDVLDPPAPPSALSAISEVSSFSEPSPFSDLSFSDLSSPSTNSERSDRASASPSDFSLRSERSGSVQDVPGLSHPAICSCSSKLVMMFAVQVFRSS